MNNINQFRNAVLCSAAVVTLFPAAATAQQGQPSASPAAPPPSAASPASNATLGDIVVTARRVAEKLQNIPVAVTVFSGSELRAQNARTTQDIQFLTPNLSIRENSGNPSSLIIEIRGQVQGDVISTLDPSVGTYVDGVYFARAIGLNAGLLDVQRVEVLKGPQGTLFGRNTTGGALNITTTPPDLKAFGGSAHLTAGSYGEIDTEGVVNIPLVTDKLAVRIAAEEQHTTGYAEDLTTGRHLNGIGNYTVRGSVLWVPTDTFRVAAGVEHFHMNQAGPIQKPVYVSPAQVIPIPGTTSSLTIPALPEIYAALASGGCFDPTTLSCPGSYRPGSSTFASYIGGDPYKTALNLFPQVSANTTTAHLDVQKGIGSANLHYIGAYRKIDDYNPIDLDGTPFEILQSPTAQSSQSWSHELQLTGKSFDDRLSFTTGAFYFHEHGNDSSNAVALPLLNPLNPSSTFGLINNSSYAGYGQADFKLTHSLTATGGIRYSVDKKALDSRSSVAGVCSVPVALRNNPGVPCSALFKRTDHSVSYTAALNYHINSDILLYGKTSKGFRAGGFNLRGTSVQSFAPFAPETVTDYEIGAKSEFLNRRLRLNVAVYQSNYNNIQETTLIPNGAGSATNTVTNAAKGVIRGGEAELAAVPVAGLRLSANLGITDAKYKSFSALCPDAAGGFSACDRSHEPFTFVPKATWSLSGQYTHPVPLGEATFRLDYSHTSTVAFQGITYTLTPNLIPYVRQTGYGLLNGRIEWHLERSGISLAVFGRNLADKRFNVQALDFVNSGLGYIEAQPGPPRELGGEVGFQF